MTLFEIFHNSINKLDRFLLQSNETSYLVDIKKGVIFQNFQELATTQKKKDCLKILHAGLEAANPENIIPKFVTPTKST